MASVRGRGTALLTPQEMSSDICRRVAVVLITVCLLEEKIMELSYLRRKLDGARAY